MSEDQVMTAISLDLDEAKIMIKTDDQAFTDQNMSVIVTINRN